MHFTPIRPTFRPPSGENGLTLESTRRRRQEGQVFETADAERL